MLAKPLLEYHKKAPCQEGLIRAERTREAVAVSGKWREGGGEAEAFPPFPQTNLGGGEPSLDYYAISRRHREKEASDRAEKTSRRARRFYQRFFTGVGVGGALRFLTLTTSDEALGRDIHRDWSALVKRMRRRWGRFEYIGVRECKGDRGHLHVCFRGSYMKQAQISAMWQSIHQSQMVDIRQIRGARGGARYMVKYLVKEASGRYWQSYNWVFKGWVGWSKRVRQVVGVFPSGGILAMLARLEERARQAVMWELSPVSMMPA